MHQYLDWLLNNQLRALIDRQRNLTLFWVNKLGFLQVVWLTLKHFFPQSGGAAVNVLSDNATTVAYINKEGVMQSPSLCRLALQVSTWCREHPVASHFSGSKNVLADALSRGKHHHPTEWSMHKVTEGPSVLLSGLSQTSSGSNALTQIGNNPPFSLIPRVLRKQVATVRPYPIDGAVLAQSTMVTSADEHAGGPPTGDPALGQPAEELGHRNVLPRAGYLYGLPLRILC